MKLIAVVVTVAMLGLPLQGMAAEPEASPPAAAAPESAPPPSPDPAAATAPAPAPAAAEGTAADGNAPPEGGDAASTWEDPPPESDTPAAGEPPPASAPPLKPDDSVSAKIRANPDLAQRYGSAKRWAIGGGITAGVGLVLGLSGAWLAVTASNNGAAQSGVGPDYVTGGLVMAGIGGVALAAGGAVMVVGLIKRKHVIEEAETYPAVAPVAVAPWGGKNGGGLSLRGRF